MSKFSGKCDFYDEIQIFGLRVILRSKVYVGSSDTPIKLESLNDCKPYYPYLVSMSAYNKNEGKMVIRLTEKSWVDLEEERYGHLDVHDRYRELLRKEMEDDQ